MRKYRDYTDEDIIRCAKEVKSMSQLLEKLELRKAGGNYNNMKRILQKLAVDCSHWTGMAWSKDQRLKDWPQYTRGSRARKHLILDRGHRCEHCSNTEWMGKAIPLEVHHIDGEKTNNEYSNLALVCCNCHALTNNWKNKKMVND